MSKRSVPIRYRQNEQYLYESNNDNKKKAFSYNVNDRFNRNDKKQQIDPKHHQSEQQQLQPSHSQDIDEQNLQQSQYSQQLSHDQGQNTQAQRYIDDYEMSSKGEIGKKGSHYELTFKKEFIGQGSQEQSAEENMQMQRSNQEEQWDDSESFEEVGYQGNCTQKSIKNDKQAMNSKQMIERKEKLYLKYYNAMVQYHWLHCRKDKNIQEKQKEYLLSLLLTQLQKNIFVAGLRVNVALKRQINNKNNATDRNKSKGSQISKEKSSRKQNDESGSGSQQEMDTSRLQEYRRKLVVFEQMTYGIVRRKLFECFDMILSKGRSCVINRKDQQQLGHDRYPSNSRSVHSSLRNDQLQNSHQPQSIDDNNSEQYQSQESHQDSINEVDSELQNMKQLVQMIERLKKQARETDSILRRWFLKWKVYLYECILDEYGQDKGQRQDEENYEEEKYAENGQEREGEGSQRQDGQDENGQDKNSQEQGQEEYQGQRQQQEYLYQDEGQEQYEEEKSSAKYHDKKRSGDREDQPSHVYHSSHSPLQSLTSQGRSSQKHSTQSKRHNPNLQHQDYDNVIKQKKVILKGYLHQRRVNELFQLLEQNKNDRKLVKVVDKVREERLKKIVMVVLAQNVYEKERQMQLEEYYQGMAEAQVERQMRTAQLFHRTNLKARYFFELLKTTRHLRFVGLLGKLPLRVAFDAICWQSEVSKRKEYAIERHFQNMRSKLLFKSFKGLKERTVENQGFKKAKEFKESREKELVEGYFMALKLVHKQGKVTEKKAANHHRMNLTRKAFEWLKFTSSESRQLNERTKSLQQYLLYRRSRHFINKLHQHISQQLASQRLSIKSSKLLYSHQKQLLYQRLVSWRGFVVRKNSYRAIEYRLVKLRQKETKGRVLEVWLRELGKRLEKKDELDQSQQHKDWLVRYYGSLCQIAAEGKK